MIPPSNIKQAVECTGSYYGSWICGCVVCGRVWRCLFALLMLKVDWCNRLLGFISANKKDRRLSVLICSPVTPGFEVISVALSSSPLGNSDPACSSLTFIHIPLGNPSICLPSLTSFLLSFTPWAPAPRYSCSRPFASRQHSLTLYSYCAAPTLLLTIPTSVTRFLAKRVFPIPLPEKKT